MPEHSIQSSTPKLILAQRGSGWPQSPHWLLPATLCTRCSTLSPLTPRSRESVVESMLLVDGDAVRSSLWWVVCEEPLSPSGTCLNSPEDPQLEGSTQARAPQTQVGMHVYMQTLHIHTCTNCLHKHECSLQELFLRYIYTCGSREAVHLTVAAIWTFPVGGGDASLNSLDPSLSQLLRVSL